jgi:Domain of unknown function (DUF929)
MGSATRTRKRAQARAAEKASVNPKARKARQTIAARRAAALRAQARRRLLLAAGSIAIVIAVVATLLAVKLSQSPPRSAPAASARTAAQVERQIASVPVAVFDAVGAGTAARLREITGPLALTSGGKPEVLYIGGEYCPYCAAERWALAAALSRFGALSGVRLIRSSPTDAYANTPTLSFVRSSYASPYLTFVPVEWFSEVPDPSTPTGYAYLRQPTSQQQGLLTRYGGGSFPFVDIGNRYIVAQAQYLPSALAGLSWAQVAAAMHDPASPVGKDIDGAANMITAAICRLTHGQPGAVCQSAGVRAAAGS